MRHPLSIAVSVLSLALLAAAPPRSRAASAPVLDEGMWTFDDPPVSALKEIHGFAPSPEWLEHLMRASVRVNDGGSASFVSPDGLVLTNHHVGHEAISELSTPERNLVRDGFTAKTRADELACPDLELNVLQSIENVTARVLGAVEKNASEADARVQREAEIARIEKEASEESGLRCNVVELYRGGRYVLYRFKKYTEVKLVFAPEEQAAFFGGDPDNFTFPRYCLDMCIFRAYEDGKPAKTPHYLRWNPEGPKDGELVFVSGNPGSTGRLNTLAQLEYLRDVSYPLSLRALAFRHAALERFAARGDEQARRARGQIFSIENSLKALGGYQESLLDGRSIEAKTKSEAELRSMVAKQPELAADVGHAFDAIAKAQEVARQVAPREYCTTIRGSRLFSLARDIVRLTAELEKPNEDRLPAYRDSARESLEHELFSDAPIYLDLEEAMIANSLEFMRTELGEDDPIVKAALGGVGTAEASAKQAIETKLVDPEYRRELVAGGVAAVAASGDPLIQLALRLDPLARALTKQLQDEVRSVEQTYGGRIARACFALYGSSVYPDATFTPRLSVGTVQGFETGGYKMPWKTTFHGLFERSSAFGNEMPYTLAPGFEKAAETIDRDTPYNFVCTADIIGGNSGSPVVNAKNELVGLIFDGNIQSLGNRFVYDDTVARAVAVHSAGMLEAMRTVYGAEALVQEILGSKPTSDTTR